VELVMPNKTELLRRLDRLAGSLSRAWRQRQESRRRQLVLIARRLPDLRRVLTDLRLKLDDKSDTLMRRTRRLLHGQRQHLRLNSSRLFLLSPRRTITSARQQLEQAGQMLLRRWQRSQQERRRHLDNFRSHLDKLNPLAILQRGYAVATLLPENTIIRDARQAPPGAALRVRVARGRLDCEVREVSEQ
jgi:exodeoxyribonuclease VII large subunit